VTDTGDMLGPIDYVVVEFPGNRFNGQVLPALTRLIADGTVRVLDLAFVTKDADGALAYGEIADVDNGEVEPLKGLEGFLADVLSEEDLAAAAAELSPNSSAAMIVWENTWAAPFVHAVRGSGGEVIASGRIPADTVLDLLAVSAD
jgi:Family of unknown function (DUF6325)